MVKIVSTKTREIKEREAEASELINIIKSVFNDKIIIEQTEGYLGLFLTDFLSSYLFINPSGRTIAVKERESLPLAMRLAKAFENSGKGEYTIRKTYQ